LPPGTAASAGDAPAVQGTARPGLGLGQPGRQRSSHRLTHVIFCHRTAFYDSISFNDLWARVQPGEPKPLQY
jgi:hypothetical protein